MPQSDEPNASGQPDEIEVVEPQEGQEEGQQAAPEAAPPTTPDPRDAEIERLRAAYAQESQERARLQGSYDVLARQPAASPAPAATVHQVTEDDIEAALEAGDNKRAARLSSQMAKQAAAAAVAEMRTQIVDPLVNQVQNYGMPAISGQATELVRMSLDPEDRAVYDRYKAEIDKQLNATNAEFKLAPSNIRAVFDYVAGVHRKELQAEAIEADRRGRVGGTPQPTPGRVRSKGSDTIPDAEALYGKDVAVEVRRKGGEDAYARKQGYKDWADRYRQTHGKEGSA